MEVMHPMVVVLKNAIYFIIFIILQHAMTSFAAGDVYTQKRQQMVEQDIRGRGVKDPVVLRAMGTVPRHLFEIHRSGARYTQTIPYRSKSAADHTWDSVKRPRPLHIMTGGTITIMVTYEEA